MLEQTKRIPVSFRISSKLSKVEPEPGAGPSHRLRFRLAPQHWREETKHKQSKNVTFK